MFINLLKFRVIFLLASAFFLCQCSDKEISSIEPVAAPVKQRVVNPYKLPAATYLSMAKNQEGSERQTLLMSAAGRLISEGQWRRGTAILAQTNDLAANNQELKKLLLAKVELMRDRPKAAIKQLEMINQPEQMALYHQIQYHELLAQSYRIVGNYPGSILERSKLESLLPNQKDLKKNRRAMWLTLFHLPESELMVMANVESDASQLQGWAQLALISRTYRTNNQELLTALKQWQSTHANHPGTHMIPASLEIIAPKLMNKPKKVALLLPLSGALSGPGKAVYDGFKAAQKASKDEQPAPIQTYDTNKGDITELYQQAIRDGAEYVVGPLIKNQVTRIAGVDHPVPTLLLNDSGVSLQENSYLFGLSPVNEAVQVAMKAKNKGYNRTLIIAPQNDWGNEITQAFTKKWSKEGGKVVAVMNYAPKDDLNHKIRDLLQITESQNREKQIKEILGYNIESTNARRQDFDMIFLLAYPTKARQIMPLLKYYYAGDVPVFATSSVYTGSANALKDKDLDGIIFCDIPWVFSHQAGTRNWPEQWNSYNRLYALGMDSYALSTQINQLMLFPADGALDTNATLYLKSSQQIARILEWGQFKHGLAHSIDG